ncbi:hypothetical protein BJY22_000912 [Kribbella shirazensis]|uniref:Uncharacterized protein n=1 Tax=Kribbella shirazensis TaxID=1105143 RepID=A0A7X5V5W8_9ACTN|nr:hypothetical protein [Kribbella shirazensis]
MPAKRAGKELRPCLLGVQPPDPARRGSAPRPPRQTAPRRTALPAWDCPTPNRAARLGLLRAEPLRPRGTAPRLRLCLFWLPRDFWWVVIGRFWLGLLLLRCWGSWVRGR